MALASLFAAALGVATAAEPPLKTVDDLLRDGRFKSAYGAALGPQAKVAWLSRMSNSAPVARHRFDGVDYEVATPCKPHDCADNNLLLLYAPASGKVYGHLHMAGRVTLIGAPDKALQAELARLWKREFRQT